MLGKRKPARRYRKVVFPQPDGPRIVQDSPFSTCQLKASKIGSCWLKRKVIFEILIIEIIVYREAAGEHPHPQI
jgi:hypothetical protein